MLLNIIITTASLFAYLLTYLKHKLSQRKLGLFVSSTTTVVTVTLVSSVLDGGAVAFIDMTGAGTFTTIESPALEPVLFERLCSSFRHCHSNTTYPGVQ